MFSVLILNQIDDDPTVDVYGDDIDAVIGDQDIEDLEIGSIVLAHESGVMIPRGADNADIADSVTMGREGVFHFINRTRNGIQKGIPINVNNFKWEYRAYAAGTAQVTTVTIIVPELDGYVGQYATLSVVDTTKPEYDLSRVKTYTVQINEAIVADANQDRALATAFQTLIDADEDRLFNSVRTDEALALTARTAGKRFVVNVEDVIRDSTVTTNTQPVSVTSPTSELAELEKRRSSQEGYNISDMAVSLYDIKRATDSTVNYDIFTIQSTNNIGKDKGHQFENTQVIAVPTGCTKLVEDLQELLEYLSGDDDAATWSNI